MEKKQLNFNAPILSVRRIPSKLTLLDKQNAEKANKSIPERRNTFPSSRTDLSLDQVTKPVAVPFMWEHMPGRSKSKSGPLFLAREERSISPGPPPGRAWGRQSSRKEYQDGNNVTRLMKSGPLPFLVDNVAKLESVEPSKEEKGNSDSEEDADAYSDAPETLSPTASFSLSCTISGFNESDGLDVKPSGNCSSDPEIQHFMMSRFLPAAKAMTLESPQCTPVKPSAEPEQLLQVRKIVTEERSPLYSQNERKIVAYIDHQIEDDGSESGDETLESHDSISGKGCGLLPRISLKTSLCLLNPVPAIKSRSQSPKVSASEIRRLTKAAKNGPPSHASNKNVSDGSKRENLNSRIHVHTRERRYKETDNPNQFSHISGPQEDSKSSHQVSGRGNISPYRNQRPPSPFRQGAGFLGIPKDARNWKAMLTSFSDRGSKRITEALPPMITERELDSANPVAEKTLYIDRVHVAKNSVPNSGEILHSSHTKREIYSAVEESGIVSKTGGMKEDASTNCSAQELKCLDTKRVLDQEFNRVKAPKADYIVDKNIKKTPNANEFLKPDVCPTQPSPFPPLPKTPSDSWLWRALPSAPSKFPSSQSRKVPAKKSPSSTKWETIVKTSKLHLDHTRYSEELVAPSLKQSKH